jgi:hypothetical protein
MSDKRQTHPLVREGALIGQDRNCQRVNKHLVMSPRWGSTPRHTDRPTVSRNVTLTLISTSFARTVTVVRVAAVLTRGLQRACSVAK